MTNISNTVTDTAIGLMEVKYITTLGYRLGQLPLTSDDLEPFEFKFIKITGQNLFNGDIYDVGVNRSRIGSHPCAVDWHHHL